MAQLLNAPPQTDIQGTFNKWIFFLWTLVTELVDRTSNVIPEPGPGNQSGIIVILDGANWVVSSYLQIDGILEIQGSGIVDIV